MRRIMIKVIRELSRIGTHHALVNSENQDVLCH